MTKITYVGAHRAGIYLPGDVYVEHGASVVVDKALADELCARTYGGEPEWVCRRRPPPKCPSGKPAKSRPADDKES